MGISSCPHLPQGPIYLPNGFQWGISGFFGPVTWLHHQEQGFRARWSTAAVTDMHPSFLPAVPMLAQIPVVTNWYLDEVWEDFLSLLSLTQNTTIWYMLAQSFHLCSYVSGFLGKEMNIWKDMPSLACIIGDITQWKQWLSCSICFPSRCIFMLEVCVICGSPPKPVPIQQTHLKSWISE